MQAYRLSNGIDHLASDIAASHGGHSLSGPGELSDDSLEANTRDVSESLRRGEHVGTQGVDDDFYLTVFDLLHQRTQAKGIMAEQAREMCR